MMKMGDFLVILMEEVNFWTSLMEESPILPLESLDHYFFPGQMLFPPSVPGWWDVDADGVAKPPGDPRMEEICHPNCVRLYAVFDEEHQNGKIYAVMERFGSCPAPVARWFIPWFIPLYIGVSTNHSRWCRISSIHSMARLMVTWEIKLFISPQMRRSIVHGQFFLGSSSWDLSLYIFHVQ